ncbi:DarT ssDNA thymidine ADP-ribosyltransferase family protein [Aquabacterium sp.]|uniref:DarT ssDNA thymidine ADP-ribosyltransferase family protein n=1 Tax=Aquabacterium sp. TaxID=1872578 RepID=UPI00248849C8|nr:DarT ssDNA thymidine ADP-ribosyltransferase family protein [Aquabacterium sp.]MDI1258130.1 DarT ssDNA thymidine ADP-ribosyltransferase family protein [Aquabacterium sp.]
MAKFTIWHDTPEDNDRKRRKQAEFLVWQGLDWDLLDGIGVINAGMRQRVQGITRVTLSASKYPFKSPGTCITLDPVSPLRKDPR